MRDYQIPQITREMISAGAAKVAGSLQLYDLDSPGLCEDIAEEVLRVGFALLAKEQNKR